MAEESRTAAVPSHVEQVAPGIPAVEVDPTNELLDGENLDEKAEMLAEEPVHVDESGRRLVHDNPELAPPQSANLELRKGLLKTNTAFDVSVGRNQPEDVRHAEALKLEREGLTRRAAGGDEKAKRRIGQVDAELKNLGGGSKSDSGPSEADTAKADAAKAAEARAAADASKTATPQGRSSRPTTKG